MRITFLLLYFLLFYACSNHENEESTSCIMTSKGNANSITPKCTQRDTITGMGTKIHYLNENGKFQISWSDRFYNRIYDSIYSCYYDKNTGLWDFVPKLYYETKNHLIFTNILWTSSGGNPSPIELYAIICPKNKKEVVVEKELFICCKADYLVYGDFKNENIHILNIETKRSQTFLLNPKPHVSRSPTLSILHTNVEGNVLEIKYESLDEKDEIKVIDKCYNIEI